MRRKTFRMHLEKLPLKIGILLWRSLLVGPGINFFKGQVFFPIYVFHALQIYTSLLHLPCRRTTSASFRKLIIQCCGLFKRFR